MRTAFVLAYSTKLAVVTALMETLFFVVLWELALGGTANRPKRAILTAHSAPSTEP
jgi:hypothetical protein